MATLISSKPNQSQHNEDNAKIHKPFSEKITELLACIQTVFHIVVQDIKPIVFLPLKNCNFNTIYKDHSAQITPSKQ